MEQKVVQNNASVLFLCTAITSWAVYRKKRKVIHLNQCCGVGGKMSDSNSDY